ncbi:MAG: hypothetical protein ACI841_000358 [Planctomycetota bacterium]|jgi:hypothetical protein
MGAGQVVPVRWFLRHQYQDRQLRDVAAQGLFERIHTHFGPRLAFARGPNPGPGSENPNSDATPG